jgi:iron complex transport system substrate-binding protein
MATHRRDVLRLLLAACLLFAAACSSTTSGPEPTRSRSTGAAAFPVTVTDDDGVDVTLDRAPQRIVTFAPSITEIVFALGLGDRLVGVSGAYDDYPPAAKHIEQVGGAGEFGVDPNVEKVVDLHADLFLTISGGDDWKRRLRDLHVPVFTINATTLPDAFHDMETVGELTGTDDVAKTLVQQLRSHAGLLERSVADLPQVTCFFETGYGPPVYTVGPGSFIFDLLHRAGCRSITASARTAYPQWSVEALVRGDPNSYLLDSESGVTVDALAKRPGFDALTAVQDGRVYLVNGDLVARPGPRVVDGLAELAKDIHPEAFG